MESKKIIYTNDVVDICYLLCESGNYTKKFYILYKGTNNSAMFNNGFKTVKEFKDSIILLESELKNYRKNPKFRRHEINLFKEYIKVYNSVKTNWADTKFLN